MIYQKEYLIEILGGDPKHQKEVFNERFQEISTRSLPMQIPYTVGAPVKTGEDWWMKVPYGEGVANHTGPESCVDARKGIDEALTGEARAGLLSRESYHNLRGADGVQ